MASQCIEWPAARSRQGYGVKWHKGKVRYVHRIAYEQAHGVELRPDQFVCHKCDNRPCYNVEHLFLGTHADNMADMRAKGRGAREFALPQTRLSDEQVAQIRRARAAGARVIDLAEAFGVHQSHISKITAAQRRITQEG